MIVVGSDLKTGNQPHDRSFDDIISRAFKRMEVDNFDTIRSILLFLAKNPNSGYTKLFKMAVNDLGPAEFYRSFSMACRLGLIEDIDGDLFNLDLNYETIYELMHYHAPFTKNTDNQEDKAK